MSYWYYLQRYRVSQKCKTYVRLMAELICFVASIHFATASCSKSLLCQETIGSTSTPYQGLPTKPLTNPVRGFYISRALNPVSDLCLLGSGFVTSPHITPSASTPSTYLNSTPYKTTNNGDTAKNGSHHGQWSTPRIVSIYLRWSQRYRVID